MVQDQQEPVEPPHGRAPDQTEGPLEEQGGPPEGPGFQHAEREQPPREQGSPGQLQQNTDAGAGDNVPPQTFR